MLRRRQWTVVAALHADADLHGGLFANLEVGSHAEAVAAAPRQSGHQAVAAQGRGIARQE